MFDAVEELRKAWARRWTAEVALCSREWSAVLEALSHLYEVYYGPPQEKCERLEEVLEALDALMHTYDDWLG